MTQQNKQPEKKSNLPKLTELKRILNGYPQLIIDLGIDPPDWEIIPEEHRLLIRKHSKRLKDRGSYLKEKLDIILLKNDPTANLEWFQLTGVLAAVLPELQNTVELSDENERRHKHVWGHTKKVVAQSTGEILVRYAALFHDIGKVKTRKFTDEGKVTFYGHDLVGARQFRKISKKLNLEPEFLEKIIILIRYHLRPGQYETSWTDSAVRRLVSDVGGEKLVKELLKLARADITTKYDYKRKRAIEQINKLEKRISKIIELDSRQPPFPKGLGNAIMEKYELEPGPVIGKYIKWLHQEIENGVIEVGQDYAYYLEHIDNSSPWQ
ncbi:MAG: HD domain-containing protein [Deltaproteobacteria bacterium]|nr:HD domain-containing protein [Deltaproteobacteria bacterium]